ncbi:hypothetical protein AK812_SmicGene6422 [Symbiodinium microadriaticum]|uniref:Uncharacterized protein n=1 Tax=Symbiodinium microadriaticum TaxID=2951 RepID=A0A1Q9ERC5_SYMMI|nr:hypothetical protein AK812_SmicGene6422 [Symbiodinium microadriaticum]
MLRFCSERGASVGFCRQLTTDKCPSHTCLTRTHGTPSTIRFEAARCRVQTATLWTDWCWLLVLTAVWLFADLLCKPPLLAVCILSVPSSAGEGHGNISTKLANRYLLSAMSALNVELALSHQCGAVVLESDMCSRSSSSRSSSSRMPQLHVNNHVSRSE